MKGHTGPCDYERGGEIKCVGCRAKEPLTADTITDEQIRELRLRMFKQHGDTLRTIADTTRAGEPGRPGYRAARARLAKILNARNAKETR